MKIKFLITDKGEDANQQTIKSLNGAEYCLINESSEDSNINFFVQSNEEDITHVCILPGGSELSVNFFTYLDTYYQEGTIMLPIVEWAEKIDGKFEFRAFLNAYIWQSMTAEEVGTLDLNFAKQQLDNTLYGAIIPINILKENKFKENFKYYSHSEYLCRVLNKGVEVIGMPKFGAKVDCNYQYKGANPELKMKFFNAVIEQYSKDEDVVIA